MGKKQSKMKSKPEAAPQPQPTEKKPEEDKKAAASTGTKLDEAFAKIALSTFPPPSKIVEVEHSATVHHALQALSHTNILCAVLVDNTSKFESWIDKYHWVDMADIVNFALTKVEIAQHHKSKSFHALVQEAKEFETHQVKDIADANGHNPFVGLAVDASVRDAMLLLGKQHMYRIAVIDWEKKQIVNVITQSAMVKVLGDNMKHFGEFGKKTLADVSLGGKKDVFSVGHDVLTIEAFKLMVEKKVGAVPVLGVDGQLIGNISMRDIRVAVATPDKFAHLFESASKFLTLMRANADDIMSPAICCKATDSLDTVVGKLCVSRIHRVYVMDDAGKLSSVVSLSDIIGVFVTGDAPKAVYRQDYKPETGGS